MKPLHCLAIVSLLGATACQGSASSPDEGTLSVKGPAASAAAFEQAAKRCGLVRAARGPAEEDEWRSVIFSAKDPKPLHCSVQWLLDHPEMKLRMDY
ncbi:hypothetical protein ACN2C7_18880 [Caulobacter sp. ErkDOM-E]|uniref:hypothetical protein n=1 Tax=Caulobacter sp. ErkDOM-E TaxID=3402778 RepID=UPI003AF89A40